MGILGRIILASNWYLYIGVFLLCTGFGTVVGILLLVFYFYDDLTKNIKMSQHHDNTFKTYNDNTFNINNLNVNSDSGDDADDFDTPMDHMSKESRDEMR